MKHKPRWCSNLNRIGQHLDRQEQRHDQQMQFMLDVHRGGRRQATLLLLGAGLIICCLIAALVAVLIQPSWLHPMPPAPIIAPESPASTDPTSHNNAPNQSIMSPLPKVVTQPLL